MEKNLTEEAMLRETIPTGGAKVCLAGPRGGRKGRVVAVAAGGSDGGDRPTETQTVAALTEHGMLSQQYWIRLREWSTRPGRGQGDMEVKRLGLV